MVSDTFTFGRGRELSQDSNMTGVIVICTLGAGSILLLVLVMLKDKFKEKFNQQRSSITPMKQSFRQEKQAPPSFAEYVEMATPPFFQLEALSFRQTLRNEVSSWHPYVSCFTQTPTTDCPRVFRILSLVMSMYVLLCVQMGLYDIFHALTEGTVHDQRAHRIVLMTFLGGVISTLASIPYSNLILKVLAVDTISWGAVQDMTSATPTGAGDGGSGGGSRDEDVILECSVAEELSYLLHDLRLYRSELSSVKREKFNDAWGLVSGGVDLDDMLSDDPTGRYRHAFDSAVYSVLFAELKRIRTKVCNQSIIMADKNIDSKDKIKQVINSFIIDLLGHASGRVLDWKFKKDCPVIQQRTAMTFTRKFLAWGFLLASLVMIQWYFYYYLRQDGTGPLGLDWCFSAVLWVLCDFFILAPGKILLVEMYIPSLIISEVRDTKKFILKNLSSLHMWESDEVCFIENNSFLFEDEYGKVESDVEYIPFNSSKYFSCGFRLAAMYREVLETHFVRKYINPLPSKCILERHEEFVNGYQDVSSYCLGWFLDISIPMQDLIVKLSISILVGFVVFLFFLCYSVHVLLILIPFYILLMLTIWLCVKLVKWWKFKVHPVSSEDDDLLKMRQEAPKICNEVEEKDDDVDDESIRGKEDEIIPVTETTNAEQVDKILQRFEKQLSPQYSSSSGVLLADGDTITTTNDDDKPEPKHANQTERMLYLAKMVSSHHFSGGDIPAVSQADTIRALRESVMSTSELYKYTNKTSPSREIEFQDDLEVVEFYNKIDNVEGVTPSHWSDSFASNNGDHVTDNNISTGISVFCFDREQQDEEKGEEQEEKECEGGGEESVVSLLSHEFGSVSILHDDDEENIQRGNDFSDQHSAAGDRSMMSEQTAITSFVKTYLEEQLKEKFQNDLAHCREEMEQMVSDHRQQVSSMQLEMHFLKQAAKKKANDDDSDSIQSCNSQSILEQSSDGGDEVLFFRKMFETDTANFSATIEDNFKSYINKSMSSPLKKKKSVNKEISVLSNRELHILVRGYATAFFDKISHAVIDGRCAELAKRSIEEATAIENELKKTEELSRVRVLAMQEARQRADQEVAEEVAYMKALAIEEARLLTDREVAEEVARVKAFALEEARILAEREVTEEVARGKALAFEEARLLADQEVAEEVARVKTLALEEATLLAEQQVAEEVSRGKTLAMEEARLLAEREVTEEVARGKALALEEARIFAEREIIEAVAHRKAVAMQEAMCHEVVEKVAQMKADAVEEATQKVEREESQENRCEIEVEEVKHEVKPTTVTEDNVLDFLHDLATIQTHSGKEKEMEKEREGKEFDLLPVLNTSPPEDTAISTQSNSASSTSTPIASHSKGDSAAAAAAAEKAAKAALLKEAALDQARLQIEEEEKNKEEEKEKVVALLLQQEQQQEQSRASSLRATRMSMRQMQPAQRLMVRRSTVIHRLTTQGSAGTTSSSLADMFPLQKEQAILESMLQESQKELEELLAERDEAGGGFVATEDWTFCVQDLREEVATLKVDLAANQAQIEAEVEKEKGGKVSGAPTVLDSVQPKANVNIRKSFRRKSTIIKIGTQDKNNSTMVKNMDAITSKSTIDSVVPEQFHFVLQKERAILETMLSDAREELEELRSDVGRDESAQDWLDSVADLEEEIEALEGDLESNRLEIAAEDEKRVKAVVTSTSSSASSASAPAPVASHSKGDSTDAAARIRFEKEATLAQARLQLDEEEEKQRNAAALLSQQEQQQQQSRASSLSLRATRMRQMQPAQRLTMRRSTVIHRLFTQGSAGTTSSSLADMFPLQKEQAILESMLQESQQELEELLAERDEAGGGFVATEDWTFCVQDLREEVATLKEDLAANQAQIDAEDDDLYDI